MDWIAIGSGFGVGAIDWCASLLTAGLKVMA